MRAGMEICPKMRRNAVSSVMIATRPAKAATDNRLYCASDRNCRLKEEAVAVDGKAAKARGGRGSDEG
jgi:hypothetical protein